MSVAFNYGMPMQSQEPASGSTTIVGGGLLTPKLNVSGVDGRSAAKAKDEMQAYGMDIYADIKYHRMDRHPTLSLFAAGASPVDHWEFPTTETYEFENYMDTELDNLRCRTASMTGVNYNYYSKLTGGSAVSNMGLQRITASTQEHAGALRFSQITNEQAIVGSEGPIAALYTAYATTAQTITAAVLADAQAITTAAVPGTSVNIFGTGSRVFGMGFGGITDGHGGVMPIQGNVADHIDKVRSNLIGLGYKFDKDKTVTADSVVWHGVIFQDSASVASYMFDNIVMYETIDGVTTTYQFNGALFDVAGFMWNATDSQFVYILDANRTNMEIDFKAGASYNFQLKEFSYGQDVVIATGLAGGGTVLTTDGVTYHSPVMLMGGEGDYVEGVPEGSTPTPGYAFKRNFAGKYNFVQIFKEDYWELTGTRAAGRTNRFIDEWKDTRDMHLKMYKDKITTQMLYGQKGVRNVLNPINGKYEVVREMGGLFCKELWNIRYAKYSLPVMGASAEASSVNITNFIEGLADMHTAFMTDKKHKVITLTASPELIADLRRVCMHSQSYAPNVLGYAASMAPQKGVMDLGFEVYEFRSSKGIVKFVEDPALSFKTKINLPYGITGGAKVHPRKCAFMMDLNGIKMRTFRNDQLRGNLMLPGDDIALREDILGEHSLSVEKARYQTFVIFE